MRAFAPVLCVVSAFFLAACGSSADKETASKQQRPRTSVSLSTDSMVFGQPAVGRAMSGSTRVRGDYAGYPAVDRLISRLAREDGFDPAQLAQVFSRVERKQWILDFMNRPKRGSSSGPTGAWTRYRAKFLTADNIANGVRFWRRHRDTLERAYSKYGVPPEYVVAILGVETRYGGYMGKHRVIDALATIAFDYPRRSDYFTGELEAFLIMSRDEGFDPFRPVGSYAGAMGLGQFMPTSFQKFAVDFDGDGRRDLWNPVDAIGSVANYFAAHGWSRGEPVTVRARLDGSGARAMKTGHDTSYSVGSLSQRGVAPTVSLAGNEKVSLIRLDARGGYQYWLGLDNFYTITRYNHSSYYAMAVHQLAQAVRARYGASGRPRISGREAPDPAAVL